MTHTVLSWHMEVNIQNTHITLTRVRDTNPFLSGHQCCILLFLDWDDSENGVQKEQAFHLHANTLYFLLMVSRCVRVKDLRGIKELQWDQIKTFIWMNSKALSSAFITTQYCQAPQLQIPLQLIVDKQFSLLKIFWDPMYSNSMHS